MKLMFNDHADHNSILDQLTSNTGATLADGIPSVPGMTYRMVTMFQDKPPYVDVITELKNLPNFARYAIRDNGASRVYLFGHHPILGDVLLREYTQHGIINHDLYDSISTSGI